MGVVYEAQDLNLGRRVALKFLPPELSRDQTALDRFLFEARTASALNHPNICTIYAVERAKVENDHEQSFIAMELLEGQSLDQKLGSVPLPLDRLLDISIQLADALDAAHAKGIIHRDIKPANIFLTQRGQVKVLDFGLAKLARPEMAMETIGGTQDAPVHLTSPGANRRHDRVHVARAGARRGSRSAHGFVLARNGDIPDGDRTPAFFRRDGGGDLSRHPGIGSASGAAHQSRTTRPSWKRLFTKRSRRIATCATSRLLICAAISGA